MFYRNPQLSICGFYDLCRIRVLCQYERKEEAPNCSCVQLGDSFLCAHELITAFLPAGIIAYAKAVFNIRYPASVGSGR